MKSIEVFTSSLLSKQAIKQVRNRVRAEFLERAGCPSSAHELGPNRLGARRELNARLTGVWLIDRVCWRHRRSLHSRMPECHRLYRIDRIADSFPWRSISGRLLGRRQFPFFNQSHDQLCDLREHEHISMNESRSLS